MSVPTSWKEPLSTSRAMRSRIGEAAARVMARDGLRAAERFRVRVALLQFFGFGFPGHGMFLGVVHTSFRYRCSIARQPALLTASSRSMKVASSLSIAAVSPSRFSTASTFFAAAIAARCVCDG